MFVYTFNPSYLFLFFFYFTPFLTHIFIRNNFPAKQNKKSKQKRYLHEF